MPTVKIQYALVRIETDKDQENVLEQIETQLGYLEHDISALTVIDITQVRDQHPLAEQNGEQPVLYWP